MSNATLYVCEPSRPDVPEPPVADLEAAAQRFFRNWSSAKNPEGAFSVARMLKSYGGWPLDGPPIGPSVVLWTLYRLMKQGLIKTAAPKDLQVEVQPGDIVWETDVAAHHSPVALDLTYLQVTEDGWSRWRSGEAITDVPRSPDATVSPIGRRADVENAASPAGTTSSTDQAHAPIGSPARRIREIASRIRLLPEIPFGKPGAHVRLTRRAGQLFDEAVRIGAFAAQEHEVLRELIDGAHQFNPDKWQEAVWFNVVEHLTPHIREKHGIVASVTPACGPIADALEAEAEKMEKRPFADDNEPASHAHETVVNRKTQTARRGRHDGGADPFKTADEFRKLLAELRRKATTDEPVAADLLQAVCDRRRWFVEEFRAHPDAKAELERRCGFVGQKVRSEPCFHRLSEALPDLEKLHQWWRTKLDGAADEPGPSEKDRISAAGGILLGKVIGMIRARLAPKAPASISPSELATLRRRLDSLRQEEYIEPGLRDLFERCSKASDAIGKEAMKMAAEGCWYLASAASFDGLIHHDDLLRCDIENASFGVLSMVDGAVESLMEWYTEHLVERPSVEEAAAEAGEIASGGENVTREVTDDDTPKVVQESEERTNIIHDEVSADELARLRKIKKRIDPDGRYIGESVAILRVFERIEVFNRRPDEPVLIVGPKGAGKTEIATLIHGHSGRTGEFRREQGVFQSGTDERVMLGHWTGFGKHSGLPGVPAEGRPGVFHTCKGGTIFLDEMAVFAPRFQQLLLDVSEGKEIPFAAGEGPPFVPDVRLILATNQDPEQLVRDRILRDDLLDRIGTRRLPIPPLTGRKEDVFPFVHKQCVEAGFKPEPQFYAALLQYNWPGNVRELLKALDLAMDRCETTGRRLTAALLQLKGNSGIVPAKQRMAREEAEREVYQALASALVRQGLRKGTGLFQQMAHFLGQSASSVSKKAKEYLPDLT